MATALLLDNPSFFASFPARATDISILFCWKILPLCLQENLAQPMSAVRFGVQFPFPASVMTVEAEQTPRRVLASRRLLFSEVSVPRLDSAPKRKRGARNSKRGGSAAPVGRRLCSGGVWRVMARVSGSEGGLV